MTAYAANRKNISNMAKVMANSGLFDLTNNLTGKKINMYLRAGDLVPFRRGKIKQLLDVQNTELGISAEHKSIDSALVRQAIQKVNKLFVQHQDFTNSMSLNNISGEMGSRLADTLAPLLGMTSNPKPKSYPDILADSGVGSEGIEIKATLGKYTGDLAERATRLDNISALSIMAHHQENSNVLFIVIDFWNSVPQITAAFFARKLAPADWRSESRSTKPGNRNTNASVLNPAGKSKLGRGLVWAESDTHAKVYTNALLPKRTRKS